MVMSTEFSPQIPLFLLGSNALEEQGTEKAQHREKMKVTKIDCGCLDFHLFLL